MKSYEVLQSCCAEFARKRARDGLSNEVDGNCCCFVSSLALSRDGIPCISIELIV